MRREMVAAELERDAQRRNEVETLRAGRVARARAAKQNSSPNLSPDGPPPGVRPPPMGSPLARAASGAAATPPSLPSLRENSPVLTRPHVTTPGVSSPDVVSPIYANPHPWLPAAPAGAPSALPAQQHVSLSPADVPTAGWRPERGGGTARLREAEERAMAAEQQTAQLALKVDELAELLRKTTEGELTRETSSPAAAAAGTTPSASSSGAWSGEPAEIEEDGGGARPMQRGQSSVGKVLSSLTPKKGSPFVRRGSSTSREGTPTRPAAGAPAPPSRLSPSRRGAWRRRRRCAGV